MYEEQTIGVQNFTCTILVKSEFLLLLFHLQWHLINDSWALTYFVLFLKKKKEKKRLLKYMKSILMPNINPFYYRPWFKNGNYSMKKMMMRKEYVEENTVFYFYGEKIY